MRASNGYETPTGETTSGATMRGAVKKAGLCFLLLGLIAMPVYGMSGGPSPENLNQDPTVEYGCTCHNPSPSERSVVMITGIPVMYGEEETYQFSITVADTHTLSGGDGNTKAGFLLSSGSSGNFSWADDQNIRYAERAPNDISHSAPDDDGVWHINWTAPPSSSEASAVYFRLAGNSVDGSGAADDGDYWNLLAFSINPPGTIETGDSAETLETRTIAVGDYEALFVIEETEGEKEAERQAALAQRVYEQGNLLYWTSLAALIVGAVFQREVLERRYDEGPEFLASELAYPQAIRRGVLSIASFVIGVRWMASSTSISFPPLSIVEEGTRTYDLTVFAIGCAFFLSAWAAYGVYRTILAARSEPQVKDVL